MLTVYSTTWCGYCVRLKKMLDRAGIQYAEVNIEEDPAAAALVENVNGGGIPGRHGAHQPVHRSGEAGARGLTTPPGVCPGSRPSDSVSGRRRSVVDPGALCDDAAVVTSGAEV